MKTASEVLRRILALIQNNYYDSHAIGAETESLVMEHFSHHPLPERICMNQIFVMAGKLLDGIGPGDDRWTQEDVDAEFFLRCGGIGYIQEGLPTCWHKDTNPATRLWK